MKKVTIVIPWVRGHLIENVKKLAIDNAGIPKDEIDLQAVENIGNISVNKLFNKIVDRTKSDYVCFLADDTLPQTNYMKTALEAFTEGILFVMTNDGTNTDRYGHFVFDRKLLPLLGGKLAHEGYIHCCADSEFITRTKEMGVYKWCQESLVIHNHPFITGAPTDEYYQKVYSPEVRNQDRALFAARQAAGWPDTNEGLI
jgi:hypothetical protein